ncbi:MAG: AAA family ATPase [Candidatus Sericytochromatia bacterium]
MLRLKKISINGFQSLSRSASVNLSDESVSVIYGDNGCGKTTFLKLIYAVLNRDNKILAQEKVQDISILYSANGIDKSIIISKLPSSEGSENSNEYNWSELTNSELADSTSLSLGVERGVTTKSVAVEEEDIFRFTNHPKYRNFFSKVDAHDFAETLADFLKHHQIRRFKMRKDELYLNKQHSYLQSIKMDNIEYLLLDRFRIARSIATEKIQNALFDTLAVVIDPEEHAKETSEYDRELFKKQIIENKARIIEALGDDIENKFKEQIIIILNNATEKSNIDRILENKLLSQLILNMINEMEIEKQLLSSINTLLETFNNYLIGNKKLVINKRDIFVDINGEKHPVNVLSSGERHILTFLSLVVIEGENRNFLIIDEPEISLNIKWQRTLMELLKKLVPNTQIIVASHSPLISKRNPQSLVKLSPMEKKIND